MSARGFGFRPLGYGVIGNTADSGSVVLGSSPGTPAQDPRDSAGLFVCPDGTKETRPSRMRAAPARFPKVRPPSRAGLDGTGTGADARTRACAGARANTRAFPSTGAHANARAHLAHTVVGDCRRRCRGRMRVRRIVPTNRRAPPRRNWTEPFVPLGCWAHMPRSSAHPRPCAHPMQVLCLPDAPRTGPACTRDVL